MSLINSKTKELEKKILLMCAREGDLNATAEACAIIGASICRIIATQEKVDFEQLYADLCVHAMKQSETNIISLTDFRKRSDHEGNT